jgi:hypothetical protein
MRQASTREMSMPSTKKLSPIDRFIAETEIENERLKDRNLKIRKERPLTTLQIRKMFAQS